MPTNSEPLTDERVEEIRARLDLVRRLVVDSPDSETTERAELDFAERAPEDIDALLADHDRLQRENAELRADKARLDWLNAHRRDIGFYSPSTDDGSWMMTVPVVAPDRIADVYEGPDIRAAIDAASDALSNPSTTPSV
jgi:hypothetical protein